MRAETLWWCDLGNRLRLAAALVIVAGLTPSPVGATTADSLTLEAAVTRAMQTHPERRAAAEEARAADARLRRARSFFLPDVGGDASYLRRSGDAVSSGGGGNDSIDSETGVGRDRLQWRVGFDQVLFDARALSAHRQASRSRDLAHASREDVRRRVGFETARAFLFALGVEEVAAAARRRVLYSDERLAESRSRAEAELVSTNDVSRSELEAATAQREAIRAQRDVDDARRALGAWLGRSVDEPLAAPRSLHRRAVPTAADTLDLLAKARAARPDAQATRLAAEVRRAAAKEPMLAALPSLALRGEQIWTEEDGRSGRESEGLLTLSSTWNLFDTERFAERAERQALVRAAEADVESQDRRVRQEVLGAVARVTSAQAAHAQAIRAADAGRRNAEEIAALFRQGLTTSLSAADASLQQFEADVEAARAALELSLARVEFRAAIGLDPLEEETSP